MPDNPCNAINLETHVIGPAPAWPLKPGLSPDPFGMPCVKIRWHRESRQDLPRRRPLRRFSP
jgi:hypothetical protein